MAIDVLRTYKSFFNSHYLSEGIRMTAGILLPAFIASYFEDVDTGIIFSLGALIVSLTDNAGPIHHRRNGMLICVVVIFFMALTAGLLANFPFLSGIYLLAASFIFSMANLYGARAGGIGIAALIALIFNFDHADKEVYEIFINAAFMAIGGLWYTVFSLALYNFRPFKLAKQAMGDFIQSTAEYLRIRAGFYRQTVDYNEVYQLLLQQQAVIQEKQNLLGELLFKTRHIVKDSSITSRTLLLIFHDMADLFERMITSYQRYSVLHDFFDETGILEEYKKAVLMIAHEIEDIGIAIKSEHPSKPNPDLHEQLLKIESMLNKLRESTIAPGNIEGFISLRRILENLQDMEARLHTLHAYTTFEKVSDKKKPVIDYEIYITPQDYSPEIFKSNLGFSSDIFRHSIRVSLAIFTGYLVALFFNIGHNYWIFLTIIVILKPAYSLTKKRNLDRLGGTIAGLVAGVVILLVVKNKDVLLGFMIILMAGGYSFMRKNYLVSVLLMTAYLLIFFFLLKPGDFGVLLIDRLIDTLIGSVIAFAASVFLFPSWEKDKIKPLMIKMLQESCNYFTTISASFISKENVDKSKQQIASKNAMVALANLSDAFNRMMNEPKVQQEGIKYILRFVVLNHMLTSYIATLSYYIKLQTFSGSKNIQLVIEDIQQLLIYAIDMLENGPKEKGVFQPGESIEELNEKADELLHKRQEELKRGLLETDTKKPLFDTKSIVNQFNLIHKSATDIVEIVRKLG